MFSKKSLKTPLRNTLNPKIPQNTPKTSYIVQESSKRALKIRAIAIQAKQPKKRWVLKKERKDDPTYMILKDDSTYMILNESTDIYQLGCTMYEIMTYGTGKPFMDFRKDILDKGHHVDYDFYKKGHHEALDIINHNYNIFGKDGTDKPAYKISIPSLNHTELYYLICYMTKIDPDLRPNIKYVTKYALPNILCFAGVTVEESKCMCDRSKDLCNER